MNTQQLGGCDWLAPVLLNQQTQFFPCVDAAPTPTGFAEIVSEPERIVRLTSRLTSQTLR